MIASVVRRPLVTDKTMESTPSEKRKWYRRCQCGNRMAKGSRSCMDCLYRRPEIKQPDDASIRLVPVSGGLIATVDASDYDSVMRYRWSARKSKRGDIVLFYAVASMNWDGKYRQVAMHRFILGLVNPSILVDHKEPLETLNNRRSNLRIADHSSNQANKRFYGNGSGFKGVYRIKKKPGRRKYDGFRGVIIVKGNRFVSPIYRTPEPAAAWYDEQARTHFGEYARTNFPASRAQNHEVSSPMTA